MSNHRVVITARSFGENDDEPFRILKEEGYEVFKNKSDKPLTAEELIPLIEYADAIIVGNDIVDEQVITSAKKIKVISRYGVGCDNINLDAAKQRGIIVTNTPSTNDNSVADLAFALILSIARNIPAVSNLVKQGSWKRIIGTEVWGKNLGIIGSGRIGRGVALRSRGFNMHVRCYDKLPDLEFAKNYNVIYCTLEEVLRESDFISIHLPLLPDTRHLINKEAFELMKPGAYIINTARGGIIDETALFNALSNKRIAGAAIDVTEDEPPGDSPLLTLDNIIITSHIGGYTYESVKNMGVTAAKNVVLALKGMRSPYIVNF